MKIQFESTHLVVFESALFRTTSTLIIAEDHLLLIDPNWLPIELDFIENYISSIHGEREHFLLYTHSDYDHIIGFGQFRNWSMIASRAFVDQANKQGIIDKIISLDDDNYVARKDKVVFPEIDIVIEPSSSELTLGNTTYQVAYTLGHNDDGIYIFDPNKGVLVAGDYLSNIEFPYIYYSFSEYTNTLNKFQFLFEAEKIEYLIPGHGDLTSNQIEMDNRLDKSREYITAMIKCQKEEEAFPFDTYVKQYDFPKVMKKFHEANLRLLKREMAEL